LKTLGEADSHLSQNASRPIPAPSKVRAPSGVDEQPFRYLLLAVWFGLLAGLAEASLLAVKKFILHRVVHHGPGIVWMAPLADVVLFGIPGLVLFLLARRWPRIFTLRSAAFLFALLGVLSLLFRFTWLHKYAALLLAAGLAMQTARLVAARGDGFSSVARRTTPWLVALVLALALGVYGWQALAERRALAQLPPAPPDAPNVLLIVLDTVRAKSLSLYGYPRSTTPQLQRLAKTGVRFDRAVAPAPWTIPSHASMFTGRFPHELSAYGRKPLDATYPTLAETLRAHGYVTAGFVANLFNCGREWGFSRGFTHYEDYVASPWQILESSSVVRTITGSYRLRRAIGYHQLLGRKTASELNTSLLRWLSRLERRPFFAFLNYFEAHDPYLPPSPYDELFGAKKPWRKPFHIALASRKWSPSQIQAELDAYEGALAYLDHHLGLLFDELEKRGVLKNTLVILTSDHGEQFGEHGIMGHGNSLYWPLLHVPLLISFPARVPAGRSVREPVALRDLPATVVDLLKLEGEALFPGRSLARYWDRARDPGNPATDALLSEISGPPHWAKSGFPVSKGAMKSLVIDRYHYIVNGDGREELYDVENDPLEDKDLTRSQVGRRALARFRASLDRILQRAERGLPGHARSDIRGKGV